MTLCFCFFFWNNLEFVSSLSHFMRINIWCFPLVSNIKILTCKNLHAINNKIFVCSRLFFGIDFFKKYLVIEFIWFEINYCILPWVLKRLCFEAEWSHPLQTLINISINMASRDKSTCIIASKSFSKLLWKSIFCSLTLKWLMTWKNSKVSCGGGGSS